jgi:phosphopantothenate-cysteine ligase
MSKILVTGGPVHAKLDAVKIVTNRFKGGRMAQLADGLAVLGHDVIYLCAKGSVEPTRCAVRHHEGFDDYARLVPRWALENDVVVLGAAVANLIPRPTAWSLEEKFPSHNYNPGDMVNVPFVVAPRVIDAVKKANPRCTLVGFKLLSNVPDEELVTAAYGVVLGARADLVVANDTANLGRKLLVTKERSVIETRDTGLLRVLDEMSCDVHYSTRFALYVGQSAAVGVAAYKYRRLVDYYGESVGRFGRVPEGHLFGCIAVRVADPPGNFQGFVCSARGKNSLQHDGWVHVSRVDHDERIVHVTGGNGQDRKASLNAPLLHHIFVTHPWVEAIVHTHRIGSGLPTLPYAPPGTVRDTERALPGRDFEIEHHGTYLLLENVP